MNLLFKSAYFLLFSLLFFISSCDREEEKIPSYLRIGHFELFTNPVSQGLNTSDIISAKVFVNGSEIGNFELPALVPVIQSGTSRIEIYPNIKENASSNSQKYYLPYEAYLDTLNLIPGEVSDISPKTRYRTNTRFRWMSDFEDLGSKLQKSGTNVPGDSLQVIPTTTPGVDQPFSGSSRCAFIEVKSDSFAVFEQSTIEIFNDLPFLGTNVYVEMDIKTNVNFQVGIYTDNGLEVRQIPVLVVTRTEGIWKKIYVNLKPETGELQNGTSVKLFFGFYKEDGDTEDKKVYLDNLKLVYLQ